MSVYAEEDLFENPIVGFGDVDEEEGGEEDPELDGAPDIDDVFDDGNDY